MTVIISIDTPDAIYKLSVEAPAPTPIAVAIAEIILFKMLYAKFTPITHPTAQRSLFFLVIVEPRVIAIKYRIGDETIDTRKYITLDIPENIIAPTGPELTTMSSSEGLSVIGIIIATMIIAMHKTIATTESKLQSEAFATFDKRICLGFTGRVKVRYASSVAVDL